jgi:predicted ATPase/DNA-binding XRE family transcriptional regulator
MDAAGARMPPDQVRSQSSFGDLLRTQRIASGLTQAELAARAGLSVRGLSDLERGVRTRPQRETVQRLLTALNVSPQERAALLRAARDLPPAAAATRTVSAAAMPHRAPLPAGSLVGRAAELARLRDWLMEPVPGIVTLTGPGGAGKTRLALAVANDEEILQRYPDGVVFVDLAAVRMPDQVLPAIAAALGWPESRGKATPQAIAQRLQDQRICLLLDNVEQVIAAAPEIAQLAALLPAAGLLVTSREPLMVRAERCLPMRPLPVPSAADLSTADVLAAPAVELFAQRAQAANPAFAVTEGNAREVALLCHHLDGLPLAIELAASLMAVYSPAMLVQRLEGHAPLPGTLRDLPERQQTLDSVVAWSEVLLTPAERSLFHMVGVFDGGFSLEAVQQVWQTAGKAADAWGATPDIPGMLGALVQRSLIQREDVAGDEPRYRLLETIRAVAADRLRGEPERDRVYAAHAAAMQQAAEAAQLSRRDAGFDARLRRLERDVANLRAALGWLTTHDLPAAARLLDTLGSFWSLCGYGAEGLAHCEAVLERYAEQDVLRCRLLRHAAWMAVNLGELGRAGQLVAEAGRLAGALEDAREIAFVRFVRGNVAQGLGRTSEAEAEIERALQAFEALGETWAIFASNAALGMVALDRGDAALSEARYKAALRLADTDIAARDRAAALGNIAVAQRWQGKLDDAATHAARALALADGIVAWTVRAGAWQVLARVSLDQGDMDATREGLQESLHHWRRSGDQRGLASCLEVVAVFAATRGEAGKAASLLAAVTTLREQVGPGSALAAAECEALAASLRETLASTAFVIAWERGRLLSLTQTVALAQELLEPPA